jgi:hypothetical protein
MGACRCRTSLTQHSGHDDELINAPKGIPKDQCVLEGNARHDRLTLARSKDIDLLRLRTISVVKYFEDEEVLSPCVVFPAFGKRLILAAATSRLAYRRS